MRRIMYVAALTAGLCVAGSSPAQPGPGGPRGRGDGPDVRSLQSQLEKLTAQVKELEAKLARVEDSKDRGRPAAGDRQEPKERTRPGTGERRGPGPDFGPGRGGPPFERFRDGDRRGPGFGGPGRFGPPGPSRFGPDGPRGRDGDRAPMPREVGSSAEVNRRIDRIIGELEQLKRELPSSRR
jgi:hypothetical protein